MIIPFEKMFPISVIHRVAASTLQSGKPLIKVNKRASECLVYVLSGTTEYNFDGRKVKATAGDILYLARDSIYTMDVLGEYSVIFADFDFVESCDLRDFCNAEHYAGVDGETRFKRLLSSWRSRSNGVSFECFSILYSIMASQIRSRIGYVDLRLRQKLKNAEKIIAENYMKELHIGELATVCGMSEGYFRRSFERIYMCSPSKFIINTRLENAAELLSYGNMTISRISETVGFSSVYYFSRAFKKEYGLSPSEFRNEKTLLG